MKMNFNCILESVKFALPSLVGRQPSDHKPVEEFQDKLVCCLNNQDTGFIWNKEIMVGERKAEDRIDVIGSNVDSNGNRVCINSGAWIIEIDATRSDQLTKKFLSRLALCGLGSSSINYVAILYTRANDGTKECLKFAKYANSILKKINKKSNFYLIIVDADNVNGYEIRYVDYTKITNFVIRNRSGKKIEAKGMGKATAMAVWMYSIENCCPKSKYSFQKLKLVFGKYISNERGKDRKKYCGFTSADGIPIYSYTQWRDNYGSLSNWDYFIILCRRHGIIITESPTYYS